MNLVLAGSLGKVATEYCLLPGNEGDEIMGGNAGDWVVLFIGLGGSREEGMVALANPEQSAYLPIFD